MENSSRAPNGISKYEQEDSTMMKILEVGSSCDDDVASQHVEDPCVIRVLLEGRTCDVKTDERPFIRADVSGSDQNRYNGSKSRWLWWI